MCLFLALLAVQLSGLQYWLVDPPLSSRLNYIFLKYWRDSHRMDLVEGMSRELLWKH